jgi:hypothetical protein
VFLFVDGKYFESLLLKEGLPDPDCKSAIALHQLGKHGLRTSRLGLSQELANLAYGIVMYISAA